MKRLITLLLTVTILSVPSTAAAQQNIPIGGINAILELNISEPKQPIILLPSDKDKPNKQAKSKNTKPLIHTVVSGDSLSTIGSAHNVEWQRLWAKNKKIKHPDVIKVGDKITIPLPSERLKRALPAVVSLPTKTPDVEPLRSYDGSNTYDYGYCTWYVKNRRGASLPNGLGDANTWYSRAAAMGMAVGSSPTPGAVGTTTRGELGHVVYVESVNGDGSITISEMNYEGFAIRSKRTASATEFVYIY